MAKVEDFKFVREKTLFGEDVLSVYRNSDKKLIASLGQKHFDLMEKESLFIRSNVNVLKFLKKYKYL